MAHDRTMLRRRATVFMLVAVALVLGIAGYAQAATIHVSTNGDELIPNDGTVSLREAVDAVNSGNSLGDPDLVAQNPGAYGSNDTVVIPASANHYLLNNEIQITKPVTIQGAGASSSV